MLSFFVRMSVTFSRTHRRRVGPASSPEMSVLTPYLPDGDVKGNGALYSLDGDVTDKGVLYSPDGAVTAEDDFREHAARANTIADRAMDFILPIKVGTPVARCPPRRSRRAELPHRAPQECAQVER